MKKGLRMKDQGQQIKRFLVTWDNGETTIIEGVTEDEAHANAARFNQYAWEEIHSCEEIKEGEQVAETTPLVRVAESDGEKNRKAMSDHLMKLLIEDGERMEEEYLDKKFFPECGPDY